MDTELRATYHAPSREDLLSLYHGQYCCVLAYRDQIHILYHLTLYISLINHFFGPTDQNLRGCGETRCFRMRRALEFELTAWLVNEGMRACTK